MIEIIEDAYYYDYHHYFYRKLTDNRYKTFEKHNISVKFLNHWY